MKFDHVAFLDKLLSKVNALGIDLSEATIDHIAYQVSSAEEYKRLKKEFSKTAELVREPIVNDRRVGVFKFKEPLSYKGQEIKAIELIEPKKDQEPVSGLEHAEYLLPVTLEEFMTKYPDVDWDTKSLNREEFPRLTLKLSDTMRVKFPRDSILTKASH